MHKQNIFADNLKNSEYSPRVSGCGRGKKQRGSHPSIFIAKTFQILENEEYSGIISWNNDEISFIIEDVQKFQQEILSLYFRHRNFSSFVRQLNMYDFHKIRNEANRNIFEHKYFKKGHKELLKNIKRKGSNGKKLNLSGCYLKENEDPKMFASQQKISKVGASKATVENSETFIRKLSPMCEKYPNNTFAISAEERNSPGKCKLIEEFIAELPEQQISRDQEKKIGEIVALIKENPKYRDLNTKKDLCKVVKRIKDRHRVSHELQSIEYLEDLSIQEEIIVEKFQGHSQRSLSLAIFETEKCIPNKSISIIGSLNFMEEANHLIYTGTLI